ncbi:protein of unknown function (DUF3384) domain containing protein [Elaphomyces granulatus]
MSSDNDPHLPQHKVSTSSFAEVFKTLATGRHKQSLPPSGPDSSGDFINNVVEGRRGSRVSFGFDPMRGSLVSNASDNASGPDFEVSLKNMQQRQSLSVAADEAENVSKFLYKFTPEQSITLWEAAAHLIHEDGPVDVRNRGCRLLEAVARRQDLPIVARRSLYESISRPTSSDVIHARVNALILLSDHGRKLDFTIDSSVLLMISSCIVPLYERLAAARSKARKGKVPRTTYDDTNLGDLLQFVVDIITLQRHPAGDSEIEMLLNQVFTVCRRTSIAVDIKNSLAIFDAIILYADVPDGSFKDLMEVLCSIHASVKSLSGPTSRAVRNLAKSRRQEKMVNLLHSLLEAPENHARNFNVTRGAIYVFTDLVRAYGQEDLPQVSFARLTESLKIVGKKDGRIEADILELVLSILEGDFAHVALREKDWSDFIGLLMFCCRRVVNDQPDYPLQEYLKIPPHPRNNISDDIRSNILASVARISASFESLWDQMNDQQKTETVKFFMVIYQHLTPSQARLLLSLVRTRRLCFPDYPDWASHSRHLIRCFLLSDQPSNIRILALEILKESLFNIESPTQNETLLELLLEDFSDEDDPVYLESLVSFVVDVAVCDDLVFGSILEKLISPMNKDFRNNDNLASRHASATINLEQSLSNICSVGLVTLFLRSMNISSTKTTLLFETFLGLVCVAERPSDSRLTILKLLSRLRCDSAGSVMVVSAPESDYLVATPSRTVDTTSKQSSSTSSVSPEYNSGAEEALVTQASRLSLKESSTAASMSISMHKSTSRISSSQIRTAKWTPSVWASVGLKALPVEPPGSPSPCICAYMPTDLSSQASDSELETEETKIALKVNLWLETIIALLQREADWDVYSFILVHLAQQLSNRDFFNNAIPQVKLLRSILCDQIKSETFREPPGLSGAKKADVAICIFESLAVLISYHEHFAKSEQDELVRAFMLGIIGSWDGTSRGCIQALSVCCHEIPLSVTKSLIGIFDKMSKVITMSNLAVHILEFLALLARLPDVYVNLREEEIRTVFGICVRFLQTSREQRHRPSESSVSRGDSMPTRLSGGVREMTSYTQPELSDAFRQDEISRYVYSLTYHVMIFWFLSLKLQDRANHVNWITSRLVFTDENGREVVEEQSQVFIDFMQRVAYSDLGDTIPFETFPPSPDHGPAAKKSWIVGMSIITIETAGVSGLTQITKRQASGTTFATYQQRTTPALPHQVPPTPDAYSLSDTLNRTAILPYHVILQMTSTAFPMPQVMQPIPLPDNDITRRAINSFDRKDIVDGHKIGVIYIDKGQTAEADILANTRGSADYECFLTGLGTRVALRAAQFNTQGLHCDSDGEYTYAWRDRVTEIVYHIATMMPTDLNIDPGCVNKKRHIGNDFVNIVFNRSNLPFNFDTIPSQFNFVNIVISPVCQIADREFTQIESMEAADFSRQFYSVKVMSKPGFPELSPAATPKVISGKNLAAFVRILAMNASVFSLVWNRQGGEHVSSWGNRLREIKRLRERFSGSQTPFPDLSEGSYLGSRRNTKQNNPYPDELSRAVLPTDFSTDWNAAAENNIFQNLDFSRWSR